jgi:predicted nuclease of predicted toxin-antitoxin system
MRFLADMGVSMRVVEWLRSSGHDAIHLREEGLQKLPNGEIFQKAIREERIVLTFDLDFGATATRASRRPRHPSSTGSVKRCAGRRT